MAEEVQAISKIDYRRLFRWLLLTRCPRAALDPRKMVLALAGVFLVSFGWGVIDWAADRFLYKPTTEGSSQEPPAQAESRVKGAEQRPLEVILPWEPGGAIERIFGAYSADGLQPPSHVLVGVLEEPGQVARGIASQWDVVLWPVRDLIRPFREAFRSAYPETRLKIAGLDLGFFLHWLMLALWALVVWALFGGALTRIAVVQLGRDETVGFRPALRYAWKYYVSYVGGPLLPLIFAAAVTIPCIVGGWTSKIPYVGELFASVLWFLPLLAGVIIALLIVFSAMGWPLMFPTISTQGSDSYDALSRAFAYPTQRPWNFAFYVAVALVVGSIGIFVYLLFAELALYFSYWAVSWGAGDDLAKLFGRVPEFWRQALPAAEAAEKTQRWLTFCQAVAAFWVHLVGLSAVAYTYSYFWCASSAIYLLLRRDVDLTELDDDIWMEEEEEELAPPTVEARDKAAQPAAAGVVGVAPPAGAAGSAAAPSAGEGGPVSPGSGGPQSFEPSPGQTPPSGS
jgi:hypothetical protein